MAVQRSIYATAAERQRASRGSVKNTHGGSRLGAGRPNSSVTKQANTASTPPWRSAPLSGAGEAIRLPASSTWTPRPLPARRLTSPARPGRAPPCPRRPARRAGSPPCAPPSGHSPAGRRAPSRRSRCRPAGVPRSIKAAVLASAEMYSPMAVESALFSLNSSHSVSRGNAIRSCRRPTRESARWSLVTPSPRLASSRRFGRFAT